MRTLLLVAAGIMLTGCVSENTALVNQHGKVIHCSAWGVGWLGAPVAMAEHHSCVKKAQAAGYTVGGAAAPVSPPASASAAPQSIPAAEDSSDAASQAFERLHPSASKQTQDAATKEAPAATQAVNSGTPASPASRLEELDKLYKAGLITKKEYEQKRQQILATL